MLATPREVPSIDQARLSHNHRVFSTVFPSLITAAVINDNCTTTADMDNVDDDDSDKPESKRPKPS